MKNQFYRYVDFTGYWDNIKDGIPEKNPVTKYYYLQYVPEHFEVDNSIEIKEKPNKNEIIKRLLDLNFIYEALLAMEWSDYKLRGLGGLTEEEVYCCPFCEQIKWEEAYSEIHNVNMKLFNHLPDCKLSITINQLKEICGENID